MNLVAHTAQVGIESKQTYLSHNTSNTILRRHDSFLHPKLPRTSISHVRLHKSENTPTDQRFPFPVPHNDVAKMVDSPRINNKAHQLRMLEMNLPDDPMKDSLAAPIRRRRERALLHAPNTPQGAPETYKLSPVTLLQQGKRGLEEKQQPKSIDSDMFLYDRRVAGSEWCVIVVDTRVGDNEVETRDTLVFDRCYGVEGVGFGLAVDFDNDEFAGGILGDRGEFLRRRMLRIADTGDDGGGWAGEVRLDEAESDACVSFVKQRKDRKGDIEENSPLLAPVMRTLVGLPPGILTN